MGNAQGYEEQAKLRARRFRAEHGLGTGPLARDLVEIIERATGWDVLVVAAGGDEHGLTMRDPEAGAAFLCVAKTPHFMRQRSSLAHELAHVLFGDAKLPGGRALDGRDIPEKRADSFARHLIIPEDGLREFLGDETEINESVVSEVVQHFLVSPPMALIQLRRTGYLSEQERARLARAIPSTPALATRFGWGDRYAALQQLSDHARAPRRLLARAIEGYRLGVVSPEQIALLRGTTAPEVVAELESVGILPEDPTIAEPEDVDWPDVDVTAVDQALDGASAEEACS